MVKNGKAEAPRSSGKPAKRAETACGIWYYRSPIGVLRIRTNHLGVCSVSFLAGHGKRPSEKGVDANTARYLRAQAEGYFRYGRALGGIHPELRGTSFQKRVWRLIGRIPLGEVRTYRQLARHALSARAARAVGRAVATNPALLWVPCHRVIRSDGSLGGYAAGVKRKAWLLANEKRIIETFGANG